MDRGPAMSTFSLISVIPDFTTIAVLRVIATMSSIESGLEELRRRLDDIDDRLQDLLIERMEIVSRVAATKGGAVASHLPAREAEILRRLAARRPGMFPTATLVRMWREMLAATVRAQGPFAVAAYAPTGAQGYWDLARDHYGSHTPMMAYQSTFQVIRAVTERRAAVGVLPMPEEGDLDPWWRHLLSPDAEAPRVIARLPFGPRGNARTDAGDALVIGYGAQQMSSKDRTLLATENAIDISRGRIFGALSALGLTCTLMASCEAPDGANTLLEIDGFVPLSDPRLVQLRAQFGHDLSRLLSVGGYAMPLPAEPVTAARAAPPMAVGERALVRG
jgi:chorismate mutase